MSRAPIALLAVTLLSLSLFACGGSDKSKSSPTSSSPAASGAGATTSSAAATATIPRATAPLKPPRRPGIDDSYDEDDKAAGRKTEEHDDVEIEIYGKRASPAEWQAAAAVAKSYFTVAAAEDGRAACSLLTPSLAAGIAGNYEKPSDPVYLHGKTCAEVMTKLFKHRHKLIRAQAAGLEVTEVRVAPRTAFVLLALKGMRERRFMGLERYPSDTWKLEGLTDSPYP